MNKRRGSKSIKAYIYLFVCLATKAIDIELASDLSSDAFLAALRRFTARRGRCFSISSDCGTNINGACSQLKLLQEAASPENIEFHFNTPSALHFPGICEAGIESVKSHLIKIIGGQVLTYEELYTELVQIESLLNSRPLTPSSSDPNDLSVLHPGHFLTLELMSAFPDSNITSNPLNRLS
ncbi:uncharacterized protein [Leptinotarsa decemlineata]|uniref:uncharacterized protein n=1 Tax=Leptinotarsa decemlineata TaxID=7539 RepID=UPI003D3058D0